ncbi:hypothetical protein [Sporomusa silvacetica]|uniref:hypothetical protein n=1 Tax=Sporomusa silvacetica TaxID=55504 RepID=UPI0011818497
MAQTASSESKAAGAVTKTTSLEGAAKAVGKTAIDAAAKSVANAGKMAFDAGTLIDKAAVEAAKSIAGNPGGQMLGMIR